MSKTASSLINDAKNIVIIQADNPDGDSLASSLALEAMLSDLNKEPIMYCGAEIPGYLHYMTGWDRVVHSLPKEFDLSIIVDTSSLLLLETMKKSGELNWLKTRPCLVIDHHSTKPTIDFATANLIDEVVATGEVIYDLCLKNNWPISKDCAQHLISSIMSDSLGLISQSTSSKSIRVVADLVDKGVSLAELDSKRREYQKKQPEILAYKGNLLKRIKYELSSQVSYITIPWDEIEKYSPLYNPSMLVIDEMRQVEGVKIAIAFKSYPDGRITAKLRSNYGYPICDKVAEKFGGGGHPYASGFRVTDGSEINDILKKCNEYVKAELDSMEK